MRQSRQAVARLLTIAGLVFAVAVLALLLFHSSGSYEVTLDLENASQLVKGNEVKVGGIPVGVIESIDLTEDFHARVKVRIDDDEFAPLHEGTRASVLFDSLTSVAGRYISLTPGPSNATEIEDGGRIDADHTRAAIDPDQVLQTLDSKVQGDLRVILRRSPTIFEGEAGDQANAGFEALNPALSQSTALAGELNKDQRSLRRLLTQSADVVSSLASRPDDLEQLTGNALQATNAVADHTAALDSILGQLPPTLRRTNTTLVNLRATLGDLQPLVRDARPAARPLAQTLLRLQPIAASARPTVRRLLKTVRRPGSHNDLIDALRGILPVAREGVPAFRSTTRLLRELGPDRERDPALHARPRRPPQRLRRHEQRLLRRQRPLYPDRLLRQPLLAQRQRRASAAAERQRPRGHAEAHRPALSGRGDPAAARQLEPVYREPRGLPQGGHAASEAARGARHPARGRRGRAGRRLRRQRGEADLSGRRGVRQDRGADPRSAGEGRGRAGRHGDRHHADARAQGAGADADQGGLRPLPRQRPLHHPRRGADRREVRPVRSRHRRRPAARGQGRRGADGTARAQHHTGRDRHDPGHVPPALPRAPADPAERVRRGARRPLRRPQRRDPPRQSRAQGGERPAAHPRPGEAQPRRPRGRDRRRARRAGGPQAAGAGLHHASEHRHAGHGQPPRRPPGRDPAAAATARRARALGQAPGQLRPRGDARRAPAAPGGAGRELAARRRPAARGRGDPGAPAAVADVAHRPSDGPGGDPGGQAACTRGARAPGHRADHARRPSSRSATPAGSRTSSRSSTTRLPPARASTRPRTCCRRSRCSTTAPATRPRRIRTATATSPVATSPARGASRRGGLGTAPAAGAPRPPPRSRARGQRRRRPRSPGGPAPSPRKPLLPKLPLPRKPSPGTPDTGIPLLDYLLG